MKRLRSVAELLGGARAVLLDFDGPVCAIFAGLPAAHVADHLRHVLAEAGAPIPPHIATDPDPLEVLRYTAALGDRALTAKVDDQLRRAELAAVPSAAPTPDAAELIRAVSRTGRAVGIVSNNSAPAVHAYLAARDLARYVDVVVGRKYQAPELMKPEPEPILEAIALLSVESRSCVLIGDSVSDVHAAHAAGLSCIGFANRPHKHTVLVEAGAETIVKALGDLTAAIDSASAREAEELRREQS